MMRTAFVALAVLALLAFTVGASAARAEECTRLCLAPVVTLGMDDEERVAAEASLSRAMQAPRCAEPILVDEQCFADDACLSARRAESAAASPSTSPGFIVARAVRAGAELRLTWAAVSSSTVKRGEHVASALSFMAAGSLDPAIAKGECTPTSAPATSTSSAASAANAPVTSSNSRLEAKPSERKMNAPLIAAIGGGALAAASLVGLGASSLFVVTGGDSDAGEAGAAGAVVSLIGLAVGTVAGAVGFGIYATSSEADASGPSSTSPASDAVPSR